MGISYGIEKSRAGGFWTEMTWLFTQAYWLETVRLVQETQTYQYPIQKDTVQLCFCACHYAPTAEDY